jgi:hypothetical protein
MPRKWVCRIIGHEYTDKEFREEHDEAPHRVCVRCGHKTYPSGLSGPPMSGIDIGGFH